MHDIDLKGGEFGSKATTGIAHLMAGIAATNKNPQRLERGVLDAFYEYFRRKGA